MTETIAIKLETSYTSQRECNQYSNYPSIQYSYETKNPAHAALILYVR